MVSHFEGSKSETKGGEMKLRTEFNIKPKNVHSTVV